ncbi:MAG: tetratricopeptide repeat protein [Planctomycetes bacterium]|nr:tetratricopeptide repeat protein [Planctomycetota bacterium]
MVMELLLILGFTLPLYDGISPTASGELSGHLELSQSYLEKGEYERAEIELEYFRTVTPQIVAQFNVGQMLVYSKGLWLLATRQGEKDLFHKVVGEYLPRAAVLDPKNPEIYLFWGNCYLQKGDMPEAAGCFNDALKLKPDYAPAYLGLAQSIFQQDPLKASAALQKALEIDPDLPDAHAMMAMIHLMEENHQQALESISRSLDKNPDSVFYRAVQAGVYYLSGEPDRFKQACDDIIKVNRRPAVFYLTLGNICLRRLLYPEAQDFFKKAIEFDDKCWDAYVALGINSLRLGVGYEADGKKLLDESFRRDPFNITVYNTLKVLDAIEAEFATITTTHFHIKIPKADRILLEPYLEELLEGCYDKFSKLYQFTPEPGLVVEVFNNHNDFSVKTLGLPGFSALGACFVRTFLVLSPTVQEQLGNRFHWGAITTHEFMHIITLQMSKFRVPRWFTEGCSVYAEKLMAPSWGRESDLEIVKALQEKKIQPLAVFSRTKAVDILHTYLFSALIVEYIHQRYGMDKISRMLVLWSQGRKTEDVFKECLDKGVTEFDKEFFAYLDNEWLPKRNLKEFNVHFTKAKEYLRQDKYPEAITEFNRAKDAFRTYMKPQDNPYYYLVRIYEETGDTVRLTAELEDFVGVNHLDFNARLKLAKLYRTSGQRDKLITLLKETAYLEPANIQLHSYLADAYQQAKSYQKAVTEYSIAISLLTRLTDSVKRNTVISDFYCNIAEIYIESGNKIQAKDAVLSARKYYPQNQRIEKILKLCE